MPSMDPDEAYAYERRIARDVLGMEEGRPVQLTADDLRNVAEHASEFGIGVLIWMAQHPSVPVEWVRQFVDDSEIAGVPDDVKIDVHLQLLQNRALPGDVLGLILAEYPAGELDDIGVRNPSLNSQALHTAITRIVPPGTTWDTFMYAYLSVLDAYWHPRLTERTGRYLTRMMLEAVNSPPPPGDDPHIVAVRTIIPEFQTALARSCVLRERRDWFTDEERSLLLVALVAR